MLKNFKAELTSETPEVILKLDRACFSAGEEVAGSFLFWQEIVEHHERAVTIEFIRRAQLHDEVILQRVDEFQAYEPIVHEDIKVIEVPFSYQIPKWLPVCTHAIRYYLRPNMPLNLRRINNGDEYAALQALIIQPNSDQMRLFSILNELGFQEKLDSRFWDGSNQEFDFTAGKKSFYGPQELTVLFLPNEDQVEAQLQIGLREPVRLPLDRSSFVLRESLIQALQI